MIPFHTFQQHAIRRTFLGATAALLIIAVSSPTRAGRVEDFQKLEADCNAAREEFRGTHKKEEYTDADYIRNYEEWPVWQYVPKFLALAEADPSDDTAFQCCQWIFDQSGSFAGDHIQFAAEQKAWTIVAAHHAAGDRVPQLCLEAAHSPSPVREQFLRDLLKQPNLSKEHAGHVTLALAELITLRVHRAEDVQKWQNRPEVELLNHLRSRYAPEFAKYISDTNINACNAETAELLRTVIDRYSDVPNTVSRHHMATLGDRATQNLYALERLSIGAEAPDIFGQDLNGEPLKLKDYRGHVVLLSFWSSGCGPCMEMVPKERELVEKFKDRPFSLLAVCADDELEKGLAAAKEHGIDWPCWYDGDNGPISKNYNIRGWPSFYLIDKEGRIADMRMDSDQLDVAIEKLLGSTPK